MESRKVILKRSRMGKTGPGETIESHIEKGRAIKLGVVEAMMG